MNAERDAVNSAIAAFNADPGRTAGHFARLQRRAQDITRSEITNNEKVARQFVSLITSFLSEFRAGQQ